MSLRTRLSVLGLAILAGTVAVVAVVAYELSRVQGRAAVDDDLRQDLAALRASLPDLLSEQAGGAAPTDAEVVAATRTYLATHPGSEGRLTAIDLGGQRRTTSGADDDLRAALDDVVRTAPTGSLRSATAAGARVRVLDVPLVGDDGTVVGRALFLGSLDDVLDDANETLGRILAAGAIGVVLGGLVLVVVTSRALRPLRSLAEVARGTQAGALSSRVPETGRRDEVGALTTEINRMLDRIDADATRRGEVLAAISHELRTPVAVAQGHLELFDADVASGQSPGELAAVLRRELERLGRLVDDLSAFSRGAIGGDVDLGAVFVPDVLDDLQERIAGLGLPDVAVAAPIPPVVIEADADRLAQSLLNLVRNAHDHTPAGTTVAVSVEQVADRISLVVADDGPGLDPALADRAFEPFVSTRRDGAAPTGLGLAVVRTLTEAQGGTADLVTGPTGTTVRLTFPIAH